MQDVTKMNNTNFYKKLNQFNKGFTFLEVLIVIFIIGLLASVTLFAVNSARQSSTEHYIKAGISKVAVQARIQFERNPNYGTTTFTSTTSQAACSTAGTIFAIPLVYKGIEEAEEASDPTSNWVATCAVGKIASNTSASSWAVAVPLKTQNILSATSGTDYYCADSRGKIKIVDSPSLNGGASANAQCP